MTVIMFMLDNSASMNQRTYLGLTYLEIARGAVEAVMKLRGKDPSSRMDRYMLLTFEEPPLNVKAGWKEPSSTLMAELKNLQATGLTALGSSLKHAFDLLNLNRAQSGLDTYGQGRCPFHLEHAVIICLTDGGNLTTSTGVQSELQLPGQSVVPGSELTKEPFRWDQRLFGVVLQHPATAPASFNGVVLPAVASPLNDMCKVTGGRSFAVTNQAALQNTLENLISELHPGVILNFDLLPGCAPPDELEEPPDPTGLTESWQHCNHALMLVHKSARPGYQAGAWPIPEAFWPDHVKTTLPSRNAHPTISFSCIPSEPVAVENFPFDKYELRDCALSRNILERRQPNTCWQLSIGGSEEYGEIGQPFGYIKASTQLNCVNVVIHPYNYPVILKLIEELVKVYQLKPTRDWQVQFEAYIKTIPIYYTSYLKRALHRVGLASLVPDHLEHNHLNSNVLHYLKKLKNQARVEMDQLVASVGSVQSTQQGMKLVTREQDTAAIIDCAVLQEDSPAVSRDALAGSIAAFAQVILSDAKPAVGCLADLHAISREKILCQLRQVRQCVLRKRRASERERLFTSERLHHMPISEMGNYHAYAARQAQPLREVEQQATRAHMFGNPFKVNKNLMIDEAADEVMAVAQPRTRDLEYQPGRKRKRGPLPKDYVYEKSKLILASALRSRDSDDDALRVDFTDTESVVSDMESPVLKVDLMALRQDYAHAIKGIRRHVRQPGQKFDALFELLADSAISQPSLHELLTNTALQEASHFKRHRLIGLINDYRRANGLNGF